LAALFCSPSASRPTRVAASRCQAAPSPSEGRLLRPLVAASHHRHELVHRVLIGRQQEQVGETGRGRAPPAGPHTAGADRDFYRPATSSPRSGRARLCSQLSSRQKRTLTRARSRMSMQTATVSGFPDLASYGDRLPVNTLALAGLRHDDGVVEHSLRLGAMAEVRPVLHVSPVPV
jgi:hypothetical protein